MSKHTPGPWATDGKRIFIPGDGQIARVPGCTFGRSPVSAANARLIAAAPEMLEALESALIALRGGSETQEDADGLVLIVESAIAKATGGDE